MKTTIIIIFILFTNVLKAVNPVAAYLEKLDNSNGPHATYFRNGLTKESWNIKNGKVDGQCNFYYKNGNQKASMIFENGLLRTTATYFDKNGRITLDEQRYSFKPEVRQIFIFKYYKTGVMKKRYSLVYSIDSNINETTLYKTLKTGGIILNRKKTRKTISNNGFVETYYKDGKMYKFESTVDSKKLGECTKWRKFTYEMGSINNYAHLCTTYIKEKSGKKLNFIFYNPEGKKVKPPLFFKNWKKYCN